jgi:hypothetical protein
MLLTHFIPEQEALIGDLVEQYGRQPSRLWFWRQTLGALIVARSNRNPSQPLRLSDDPPPLVRQELHVAINLGASPVRSVGGLGLVTLGVLVAIVRPEAWWFVLAAVLGGITIGIVKVVLTRRRFRADPDAYLTQHSTRFR